MSRVGSIDERHGQRVSQLSVCLKWTANRWPNWNADLVVDNSLAWRVGSSIPVAARPTDEVERKPIQGRNTELAGRLERHVSPFLK